MDLKNEHFTKKGVKNDLIVNALGILFLILALVGTNFQNNFLETLGFIGLIISICYGSQTTYNLIKKREEHEYLLSHLYLNWFIGCFCLNIFMNVFENLPIWVYLLSLLFCLSNFFIYENFNQKAITSIAFFINGISLWLIFYYTIYLIPMMVISAIGVLALGLGFYGLVPIIVLISHTVKIFETFKNKKQNLKWFSLGIGTGFFVIFFVIIQLNIASQKIDNNMITKQFDVDDELPTYVKISQNIDASFWVEALLKENIVYTGRNNFFQFGGFEMFGNKSFNERKQHNPLLNVGYLFCNKLTLSEMDKISILQSNFNNRWQTEQYLWSGNNLETKNVKEDVRFFAQEHLAYTEMTIDVGCSKPQWMQQEAIYSFQLPEGGVATSLSLWVNGVERKGVLTTKEKAEKTYNKIVGVEVRDPSLLQWREGNRVVVRVFPVDQNLPRTFKCGFTVPMQVINNKLVYHNISIKGPNVSGANVVTRIQFPGALKPKTSKQFESKNGYEISEEKGLKNWNAIFDLPKISKKSFVWNGVSYTVKPQQFVPFSISNSDLILDLNKNWKKSEVKRILKSTKKTCFIFLNHEKIEINTKNHEEVLAAFQSLHYALLPLYDLQENSFIITKSNDFSVNFDELADSEYLRKIKTTVKSKNIKAVNFSETINPMWQTLKEQNFVAMKQVSLNEVVNILKSETLNLPIVKENCVDLEWAKIQIEANPKNKTDKLGGSDHLLRLFAFNKVLKEHFIEKKDSIKNIKFIDLAKQTNIVTPISSLIVLETDADYSKNGIEKNINTLGNANIKNHGAVPEPEEWALIIISAFAILLFYRNKKMLKFD